MHDEQRIALVKKNRPDWQRNCYNGIGGHIEDFDESPAHAMAREFWEEVGIETKPEDWEHFLTLEGSSSKIYVFAMQDERVSQVQTKTDEKVTWLWIEDVFDSVRVVDNLHWIIPMMLQRHKYSPVTVEFPSDA